MAALVEASDLKKIGIGLTGFGFLFTFLGLIFFFDKGLLAMGNILFLLGLALTIGPRSTLSFFLKPRNYKGSLSFLGGILLVLFGWAVVGIFVEAYGFFVLFSGFFPTAAVFLYKVPVLGWFLQQPFLVSVINSFRDRRVPV
ncbi:hypothetical protein O6H91_06G055100 [Diphasiastrum complanatum]|uniref:Uncharacterized protein n=1 Tax=Diphasiastrum complanatum TaxID=34168 RepID=A0ACC2DEA9_DIPCM|nr:hypothetical protein O6H91_06G055100 [Diphasiastrum complanatum]